MPLQWACKSLGRVPWQGVGPSPGKNSHSPSRRGRRRIHRGRRRPAHEGLRIQLARGRHGIARDAGQRNVCPRRRQIAPVCRSSVSQRDGLELLAELGIAVASVGSAKSRRLGQTCVGASIFDIRCSLGGLLGGNPAGPTAPALETREPRTGSAAHRLLVPLLPQLIGAFFKPLAAPSWWPLFRSLHETS